MIVDLGGLALERGGSVLLDRAARTAPEGDRIEVRGTTPDLAAHVRTWCRTKGLVFADGAVVAGADRRWAGALSSGHADPSRADAVLPRADPRWGLAARGARVEDGAPEVLFPLAEREEVWDDDAPRLYAAAAASQWDPATAIPWTAPILHSDAVEEAIAQVMTYLVENETAALLVPAGFLAKIHPHYREVIAFLATQVADEARHAEVFSRRAALRVGPGSSGRGGQASLAGLVRERDFSLASFLLSVMGEASFLELLHFLAEHGPDPITRRVARLAAVDEARHVAFAIGHLRRRALTDAGLRGRLANAVRARDQALRHTSGLNDATFDALVIVAAGDLEPAAIGRGFERVAELVVRMDRARRGHLQRLGFGEAEAAELSDLHTRNFM